ncbi:MAG: hypothetical protein WC528_02275 [Patescibacteria group bacterium]
MKKLIISQFILLLAGMIFAWTNFSIELVDWLNKKSCTTGCSVGLKNPFLTPCFYGAICFAIAFALSAVILRKFLKERKEYQKP